MNEPKQKRTEELEELFNREYDRRFNKDCFASKEEYFAYLDEIDEFTEQFFKEHNLDENDPYGEIKSKK